MNKLRSYREQAGLTQEELAEIVGVTRVTIARYEAGDRSPNDARWKKLAAILNTSVDQLMGNEYSFQPAQSATPTTVRIPVLGTVAAGLPIEAVEEIIDWEEIPASMAATGDYFCLLVKGHSMEPRIRPGDVLVVRKQHKVESGEIAIVLVNGDEGTCKKVQHHQDGSITLIATNTAVYEPHHYTLRDIHTLPVQIIGKVVELRAKF